MNKIILQKKLQIQLNKAVQLYYQENCFTENIK